MECKNGIGCNNIINVLHNVSDALTESSELEKLLEIVLDIISEHMGMIRGMLTIHNRLSGEIFIEDAFGFSEKEQARGIYKPGEGIIGMVVESGAPQVVAKISEEPMFLNRTGSRAQKNEAEVSFICVPLKYRDEVIGTIAAERSFDSIENLNTDAKLLSVIASMIAQSVHIHRLKHEEMAKLEQENLRLKGELKERFKPKNLIGSSKSMKKLYPLIEKVSRSSATVLILGESGVGKELFAHAIHYNSPRQNGPFVICNVAALSEDIIESELFGHERGAFTGAQSMRKGRFEAAQGGSIFLDEIGELPMQVQAKLLRILQQKEFERLGGSSTIKADVRIIAATNRNLEKLIEEGSFREDLYYRLNVFPITVPPLRERKTDIPALTDFFIEKYSQENDKRVLRISSPAIDMLMAYDWPGNVRELENSIERAVILSEESVIHSYHLPPTLQTAHSSNTAYKSTLQDKLDKVEYEMIVESLKESGGNLSESAKSLGLTERIIGLRVKKYKIDFRKFRN